MRLPRPGGDNELDDRTHAGGEHLVELPPRGDVAGFEGPAGGEGGAGIGVLAQDHAAHARGRNPVKGAKHVRAGRCTRKRPVAPGGKDRLPGFEFERGVHLLEAQRDVGDDIAPRLVDVLLPALERLPKRCSQLHRHGAGFSRPVKNLTRTLSFTILELDDIVKFFLTWHGRRERPLSGSR